jgi:putative endonuclease
LPSKQYFASLIGHQAEQKAKEYLKQQGLQFVEENYRVKVGEIDLIMQTSDETWVFVEVKYRQSDDYGHAAEYFTSSKRRKLIRAIMWFLKEHQLNPEETAMRIDLIALDGDQLNWIKNV